MLVFVLDKYGRIGHPTRKCRMIRQQIKKLRAKIIRRFGNSIVVQFLDRAFDPEKTIEAKFALGIDPGYKHIGYSLVKQTKSRIEEVVSGEIKTRTDEVSKNLKERALYRRNRRRVRRKNALKKLDCCKFRIPRWINRSCSRLRPTHEHLIQTHTNMVRKIAKSVPIDQINLEYFSFDSQKALNPDIEGEQYQHGPMFGHANTRAYILHRDNYTCQACREKNIKLRTHHIIPKSQGGSDRPDNQITVCCKCHEKIHAGLIDCPKIADSCNNLNISSVLNSSMKTIFNRLVLSGYTVNKTIGCETRELRRYYALDKSHQNDAYCIAVMHDMPGSAGMNTDKVTGDMVQYRRHNRSFTSRIEDRKYYVEGSKKPVAFNRRKRTDQKKDSLQDLRQKDRKMQVKAYPGGRVYSYANNTGIDKKSDMLHLKGNMLLLMIMLLTGKS